MHSNLFAGDRGPPSTLQVMNIDQGSGIGLKLSGSRLVSAPKLHRPRRSSAESFSASVRFTSCTNSNIFVTSVALPGASSGNRLAEVFQKYGRRIW